MQIFVSAEGPILSKFPEHAKLIGALVTDWNSIENTLVTILAVAMGQAFELVHPMIYALRNSAARIDVMEPALLALFKKKELDVENLSSILEETRKIVSLRNKYAHSLYAADFAANILFICDMKDGIPGLQQQANQRPLKLADLEDAVKRSHALTLRLMDLLKVVLLKLPPKALRAVVGTPP